MLFLTSSICAAFLYRTLVTFIKGKDLGVSGLKKGNSQSVSQGTQAVIGLGGLRVGYAAQSQMELHL